MAKYALNERGFENAKRLINARQYVLDSNWGDVQPNAASTATASSPATTAPPSGATRRSSWQRTSCCS